MPSKRPLASVFRDSSCSPSDLRRSEREPPVCASPCPPSIRTTTSLPCAVPCPAFQPARLAPRLPYANGPHFPHLHNLPHPFRESSSSALTPPWESPPSPPPSFASLRRRDIDRFPSSPSRPAHFPIQPTPPSSGRPRFVPMYLSTSSAHSHFPIPFPHSP